MIFESLIAGGTEIGDICGLMRASSAEKRPPSAVSPKLPVKGSAIAWQLFTQRNQQFGRNRVWPMLKLNLDVPKNKSLSILCLGSHSDDIEIGCGGSILRLVEEYPECKFQWVVFSAIGVRKGEAQRGAESFVGTLRLKQTILKEFVDGFMPYKGADVKATFEELKQTVSPDLIFTHNRKDAIRITG